MDLRKVSRATGTLQDLINDYPASPSTMDEPSQDESCNQVDAMMHNLSVKLASPSPSNILEQDSPTPLRKYMHHPYSRSSKSGSKYGGSPVKVSPLRLALGNNAAKGRSDTTDSARAGKIFDDNPFLSAERSTSIRSPVPDHKSDSQLKTSDPTPIADTISKNAAPVCSDEARSKHECFVPQVNTLLPMPVSLRARGCSTNTQATASSTDQDDQIRESFDFTGEYRALNENGTRQSFVDELGRFGLSVGEASFELGNFALGSEEGSGVKDGSTGQKSGDRPRDSALPGVIKRNSYGFNKDFMFGSSHTVQPTTAKGATGRFKLDKTESPHSPPRDPLPVPQGSPQFKGRFRFKQIEPEDSMFSIASMSSVGSVVDTGIAGKNFFNIFDREFGAALNGGRDISISSTILGSSTQSRNAALDHSRSHFRKLSHARMPSSASITSRNSNSRTDARHRREESSLGSNPSVIRYTGRSTVDSDRMLETDNRAHQLYRIEGSPVQPKSKRALVTHAKNSLLDSSRHISTEDNISNSLPEITEDSIFHFGPGKLKSTHFAIKSIDTLASVTNVSDAVASVSPLALKGKKSSRRSPARMDSLEYHKRHSKDSHQDVANIDQYLVLSNVEETIAGK